MHFTPRRSCAVAASGLALVLAGCSGAGSTSPSTDPGSVTTSPASSPRTTQSSLVTAANGGGGGGDFCAATGKQFDAARGWMDEKVTPTDYIAAIDNSTATAPAEIATDVTFVNTTTKKSVTELEAVASGGSDATTTPIDVKRMKAGTAAWRKWTDAHCSADIAAKWDTKS